MILFPQDETNSVEMSAQVHEPEFTKSREELDSMSDAVYNRIRSVSEIYSIDSNGFGGSPDSKATGEIQPTSVDDPTFASYGPQTEDSRSNIISGTMPLTVPSTNLRVSRSTRGRLFSELSVSDMPAEVGDGRHPHSILPRPLHFSQHHISITV